MDESIGMLSVVAVLVFGIWLVDYSGDASRASAGIQVAATQAAQYAADSLVAPPSHLTDSQLSDHATEIAQRVVGTAAIGNCDAGDARFDVSAQVHRDARTARPAAVTVEVTCPLSVSALLADTVSGTVAVPIPMAPVR